MAGLIDIAPPGAAGVTTQGTEAIPASPGQVLGAAASEGLEHAFPSAEAQRQTREMGLPLVDPESGQALFDPTQATAADPVLDPKALNEQFGIPGRLDFTTALPQSVAAEMQARKREQIGREDAIARREPSLVTGGAARFAAGLAGGLPGIVDPVNLAASFMPVVSEARAALLAARLGALGGRAATGAIEGAAGQALLTPLQFGMAKHDREDYGAVDGLLNIALGSIFGGGLHLLGGRFGAAEGRLSSEIDRAPPETRESLLRAGIADLAEDRPVESPAATYDYIRETGGARPYEPVPREPLRLAEFLRQQGGVQNQGGELGQMLDRVQSRPGLINKEGLNLDHAAERAWEAGYLPGLERPDINTLLDHLESDLKGNPVYADRDQAAAASFRDALDRNAEIDRLSQAHGIPISGLTRDQFFDQVAQKLGAERTRAEAQAAADWFTAHDHEIPFFGAEADFPAQRLEDEYRQEAAAERAQPGPAGAERPGAAAGAAGADETAGGQGGAGAGSRRRGEPPAEPEPGQPVSDSRPPTQILADDIAQLDRELAAAGIEDSAELTAANDAAAEAEAIAKATEQGAMCLGRRA